jgi:hypothetical protein
MNYNSINNYCVGSTVKVDSQKFVEPTFKAYLDTGNDIYNGCKDFEDDLFVYGRKEHVSAYRYNPLFERDGTTKQDIYIKKDHLLYDETIDTGKNMRCNKCAMREN